MLHSSLLQQVKRGNTEVDVIIMMLTPSHCGTLAISVYLEDGEQMLVIYSE